MAAMKKARQLLAGLSADKIIRLNFGF